MLIILLNSISARSSSLIQVSRLIRTPIYVIIICMASSLSLANSIDGALEDDLEVQMEEEVEDQVEDEVEDQVEDEVEDEVEDQIEDEVEDQVEDEVEDQVEDEVEDQVEDEVEDQVEDEVEGQVEDEVEGQVEDEVEGDVEYEVEGHIENDVTSYTQDSDFEEKLEDNEAVEIISTQGIPSNSFKIEQHANTAIEIIEEMAGSNRIAGELLILTDSLQLQELKNQGVEITDIVELNGLNQFLIEVKESSMISKDKKNDFEFNHVYTLQGDQTEAASPPKNTSLAPKQSELADSLSKHSKLLFESPVKIGVIDSGVDLNHSALKDAKIHTRRFFIDGSPIAENHGTAITSILVGKSQQMRGLIPSAEIYNANVFFSSQDNKQYASVKSLIMALNWMVENHVEVINMSLSGPPNPILEKALAEVKSKGVIMLAAAGNNGPAGAPAFPAAYNGVIAVTAVNHNNFAYFNANRGAYIDISALGVNVFHATPKDQYEASTGTSYAVPFVTAISAALLRIYKTSNIEDILFQSALDLGEKGKDSVYGYGLVQMVNTPPVYQEVASNRSDSCQSSLSDCQIRSE